MFFAPSNEPRSDGGTKPDMSPRLSPHGESTTDQLRVALIDLWADPGTRNYTAPLAASLASRPDVSLFLYLNRRTPLSLYEKAADESRRRLFRAPVGYRPFSSLLLQPFEMIRLVFRLWHDQPDLLHFSFMHPWLTILLPLLRLRFPIAVTWHDLSIHEGERFLRHRLATRAMLKYAGVLFVHSENLREKAISRFGVAPDRLAVVPHGTYEHWRQAVAAAAAPEAQDRSPEKAVTFLFFGRILPYKAPDILFKAFGQLVKKHPEARLIVAGNGDLAPYQDLMAAIRTRLELHNRTVSEDEAVALFRRSGVVVICHREVTQSGILFAAAAMDRAVIATSVGALQETVQHGETGLLVPPEDVDALARAMSWMIEHPSEQRQMGAALRRHISETHAPAVVAAATVRGYRSMLNERDETRKPRSATQKD